MHIPASAGKFAETMVPNDRYSLVFTKFFACVADTNMFDLFWNSFLQIYIMSFWNPQVHIYEHCKSNYNMLYYKHDHFFVVVVVVVWSYTNTSYNILHFVKSLLFVLTNYVAPTIYNEDVIGIRYMSVVRQTHQVEDVSGVRNMFV
jgi:hypothetical protein